MIGRNRLERRNVELLHDAAQSERRTRHLAQQAAEIGAVLAGVEEDRAAILDIGVELGESGGRGRLRVGQTGQ